MRVSGLALFFVGLLAVIVCSLNGCGTFFSWNGLHTIASQPLTEEHGHLTFTTVAGVRYTVAVQVVFDPAGVDDKDGMADANVKMPLVVKVRDGQGTIFTQATGWLENARPNVLYSRPYNQPGKEIMLERLVGPFLSAAVAPVDVDVDLGADRLDRNPLQERRLIVYDDALPPQIRNAVIGAVLGAIALGVGFVLLLLGWWKGRRRRKRGIPRVPVV